MGYFKRFLDWQNYFHYFLLTLGLFILHEITSMIGLENWAILHYVLGYGVLFIFYFIGFIIVDSLIHGLFWILPKPLRWRD